MNARLLGVPNAGLLGEPFLICQHCDIQTVLIITITAIILILSIFLKNNHLWTQNVTRTADEHNAQK